MHRGVLCLPILACACLASVVAAPQGRTANQVTRAVQSAVTEHPVPGARVGIVVRRLSDGTQIFSLRGNERFGMASNTKLLTTAAGLWRFGPEHEFRTAIIANGQIADGVLGGELVVVGGGDPNLSGRFHNGDVMAVPREMAAAVQRMGIREIAGDLVMDDRLFDRAHRAPGWPAQESLWWYAASVSALSFNDNCVDITVKGSGRAGDAAIVTIAPDLNYASILNRCVTCRRREPEGVTFERDPGGAIVIGGRIRVNHVRSESITIVNPPLYLAAAVRAELDRLGVRIRGRARLVQADETALPEAREIFVWRSRLVDAVDVANRRSQNFYAEQILKTLGAARHGIGTFETGAQSVKEFLKEIRVPDGAVFVADGSGLSSENRATPSSLVAVLDILYRSNLRDVFYYSLATNGDPETTLKHRMTAPRKILGRIHAKTGTFKSLGISALSGYAHALDGETYAFSILTNDFSAARLGEARALEDAVCRALLGVQD